MTAMIDATTLDKEYKVFCESKTAVINSPTYSDFDEAEHFANSFKEMNKGNKATIKSRLVTKWS